MVVAPFQVTPTYKDIAMQIMLAIVQLYLLMEPYLANTQRFKRLSDRMVTRLLQQCFLDNLSILQSDHKASSSGYSCKNMYLSLEKFDFPPDMIQKGDLMAGIVHYFIMTCLDEDASGLKDVRLRCPALQFAIASVGASISFWFMLMAAVVAMFMADLRFNRRVCLPPLRHAHFKILRPAHSWHPHQHLSLTYQ